MTRFSENDDFQIALCTTPDQATAERLAELLVEQRLAACVNIIAHISSVYRWQNQVEKDGEALMLIKTHADLLADIDQLLEQEHPYEVFELISCNIEQASSAYLQWLASSLNP